MMDFPKEYASLALASLASARLTSVGKVGLDGASCRRGLPSMRLSPRRGYALGEASCCVAMIVWSLLLVLLELKLEKM